jgi:TPR repeat protein
VERVRTILLPVGIVNLLPENSWLFQLAAWLAAPFILVEFFCLVMVWEWLKDQRLARQYQNLAGAGDAIAMANLGIMYRQGRGVSRDYASAASWFRKAAEAGDVGSMIHLADMHEKGIGGLPKDAKESVLWYERAARSGSRVAQEYLERLHTAN